MPLANSNHITGNSPSATGVNITLTFLHKLTINIAGTAIKVPTILGGSSVKN
jgi:hypothetical protein